MQPNRDEERLADRRGVIKTCRAAASLEAAEGLWLLDVGAFE